MSSTHNGPGPIVVAGMHRSGTSLTASWLSHLGVAMGRDLVPADAANPTGYFEDTDFLSLNRRMLAAACPRSAGGHPDWGWTEVGGPDPLALQEFKDEAASLVAQGRQTGEAWGWKDPRSTMLLDFWLAAAPDARFLLVYRYPWEVAASIHRLGSKVFSEHPTYPEQIWMVYNRALLAFFAAHPERCVLASTNALAANPGQIKPLLERHLGLSLRDDSGLRMDPALFKNAPAGDPLPGLHALAWPEAAELLAELDAAAHLSSSGESRIAALAPRLLHVPDAKPGFSIVTPVYNDGVYLAEAIASAERSATADTELIIIDDGSSDPFTCNFLKRLRERGYRVETQPNRGLAIARNRAIRLARGDCILPLDADNRLRPNYMVRAREILDSSPTTGVVYGDREEFGLRNGRVEVPPFEWGAMFDRNTIDACAVFRRQVWVDAGGFDESLPALEDWDFWLGAWIAGWDFHHVPEVTFDYRVRGGSLTHWLKGSARYRELRHRIRSRRQKQKRRTPGPISLARRVARSARHSLARIRNRLRMPEAATPSRGAPDFLILGAMKAGTTSLFDCLAAHPLVIKPATKEIHFFDLEYHRGHAWYREQLGLEATRSHHGLSGEASPYYLFHPVAPRRVAELNPAARLIVMLRDPVARTLSHYNHARKFSLEELPLEEALAREEERLAGAAHALVSDQVQTIPAHQYFSYKARGQYAEQLEAWLRFFPPEQILVLQSELVFRNPELELRRVVKFLGLPSLPPAPLGRLNTAAYPPASSELVAALERHFAPWNSRLATLLEARWNQHLDLSVWRSARASAHLPGE